MRHATPPRYGDCCDCTRTGVELCDECGSCSECGDCRCVSSRRYEVTVFARTVVTAVVEVEATSEAEALAKAVDAAQADTAACDWHCGDGGHEIIASDIDDDLNGSLDNVERSEVMP